MYCVLSISTAKKAKNYQIRNSLEGSESETETESETEEEVTDSEDGEDVIKVFSDDGFSDESVERYLYRVSHRYGNTLELIFLFFKTTYLCQKVKP